MFIYKHNYSRKNDQESVKKHCIYTYMTSIQSTDQFPFSSVRDLVVSVKEFQCLDVLVELIPLNKTETQRVPLRCPINTKQS